MKSSGKRSMFRLTGLDQGTSFYLVEVRQVCTEHHLLPANEINPPFDHFDGDRQPPVG